MTGPAQVSPRWSPKIAGASGQGAYRGDHQDACVGDMDLAQLREARGRYRKRPLGEILQGRAGRRSPSWRSGAGRHVCQHAAAVSSRRWAGELEIVAAVSRPAMCASATFSAGLGKRECPRRGRHTMSTVARARGGFAPSGGRQSNGDPNGTTAACGRRWPSPDHSADAHPTICGAGADEAAVRAFFPRRAGRATTGAPWTYGRGAGRRAPMQWAGGLAGATAHNGPLGPVATPWATTRLAMGLAPSFGRAGRPASPFLPISPRPIR